MASMSVLFSCLLNQSLLETIFFRSLRKKIGHLNTLKENLNKNIEDLSIFWIGRMKCAEYEHWLKEVSEFRSQTTDIEQKFKKYSSSNCCPHLSLLIKLNKSVTSATEKVISLSESLDVNERSTTDVPVGGPMTDPGVKAILSNYPTILKKVLEIERGDFLDIFPDSSETMLVPKLRAVTSTVQILHKILEHLSSADTHVIAICGDDGIGKTTMLRILRNLPKTKEMFEIIIWVTVSRSQNTRKVQDEIAKQLSVRVTAEEPDDRVAMRLFNRLVGMKFLLLLDDVLQDIDLMKVGIPNLIHSAGCKVVYSSLHVEVCRNMGKEEAITMLHRSEEESWQLFNDVLGDSMDDRILAKEIISKCEGLSLAIETVGQALRMSIMRCNPHPWGEVLRELTSPVIPAYEQGISSAVTLNVLKIGYSHLGGDDAKNCFLYSALYTDMIVAEELIDHWVMEGYIGKSETLARSRELGHNMLQQLIETTLLRRGGKQGQVEMHELHRDMALSIATGFLVWNGGRYPDAALDGQWECANRVSLIRCGLQNLPNSPNCPELLTLLLQGNRMLRVIPEDFFARMPQLCILDLSEMRIISLPCSISALVNLKALLLRNCERLALLPPEIGRLTQLEFIDLRGTRTSYLPNEFIRLSHLRTLQVTFYGYFENEKQPQIIPDNTISILLDLEELYIRVEPDDIRWEHIVEAVTKELSGLQKLTAIRFYFPTAELCKIFVKESAPWREKRLLKFHITIGRRIRRLVTRVTGFGRWSERWDRKLRFTNGDGPIPDEVKEVLHRANELYLDSHKTIKSLSEFGLGNMRLLKGCLVAECDEIEVLVKEDEQSRDDVAPEMMFTYLQYLSVQYLLKLVSIWHQTIPGGSFSGLRTLIVGGCPNLETVIPKAMALNLINLEELRVFSCRKVKIIIKGSGSEPILLKLKYLVLFSLPELERVCEEASEWQSLQVVYASSCPKLTRLPLLLDGFARLRVIGGEENWWHSLTWEEKFVKDDLEPFFYPV